MAVIFMDGLDHYADNAGLLEASKWSTLGTSVDYGASVGRFGGGGIKITVDDQSALFTVPSVDELFFGASVFIASGVHSSKDDFLRFLEGGSFHIELQYTGSGTLDIFRSTSRIGTGAIAIPQDTWFRLEVRVKIADSPDGEVEVRVNGTVVSTAIGTDTQNAGSGVVNSIQMLSSDTVDTTWDDIVVMDTTGSKNNGFLGDLKIETLYPDGDSAQIDFTPTGAGSTNADRVDEGDAGHDGDTTYVESSTVGHVDRYSYGDLTTGGILDIYAVQTNSVVKKDDAGTRSYRNILKTGTTTSNGTTVSPTTDYQLYSDVHELDPDTASDWTESGVNGIEAGQEVVS